MPHPVAIKPVFMLDGEFSPWRRLYDCTPPAGEECRRFWWAIESAPWRRVSGEASECERKEAARCKAGEAILPAMAFAEPAGAKAADWE